MQEIALERFISITYEEKGKVLKSYNKAKKYLNDTPLFLLLKLQNYLIKEMKHNVLILIKECLDFPASEPLAS